MVMITYQEDTDVDNDAIKLREKFDMLTLPDGCSDPIIYNFNINDMMPVAVIALGGSDLVQLQNVADDTVGPALERLDGVASVDITGGIQQKIVVETNPSALSGYGLTISNVSDYLAAANVLYPGGRRAQRPQRAHRHHQRPVSDGGGRGQHHDLSAPGGLGAAE